MGRDVYFSVASYPDYGQLSWQRPDDLQAAADLPATCSNAIPATSHCGRPPSRGAGRESPWGRGRPGWHLECSAMAVYLGAVRHPRWRDRPDLPAPRERTGPIEGRGDPFARYWLHNSWVTAAGEKMGKVPGNALAVDEVLKRTSGRVALLPGGRALPVDAGFSYNPSPSRLSDFAASRLFCRDWPANRYRRPGVGMPRRLRGRHGTMIWEFRLRWRSSRHGAGR